MKRQPANLSESLCLRLNSYALAASAAGVGMLALAHPAEAKIVYTGAHHNITCWGNPAYIFLAHGAAEFQVSQQYRSPLCSLRVSPSDATNGIVGGLSRSGRYAAFAVRPGQRIGPRLRFQAGSSYLLMAGATCTTTGNGRNVRSWGPWAGVGTRYLGLKFFVGKEIHYGWARLTVPKPPCRAFNAELTGYAYETVPNKGIVAGRTKGPDVITLEPGSLGALAAGAVKVHR